MKQVSNIVSKFITDGSWLLTLSLLIWLVYMCTLGVKNFAYISADGDYVPSFILRGSVAFLNMNCHFRYLIQGMCCLNSMSRYFDGKRLADQAVSRYFKGSGVILRPGFVYGSRKVNHKSWFILV